MRCFEKSGSFEASTQIKDKQTNVVDDARESQKTNHNYSIYWPLNKARKINNNVKWVRESLKNCKEHEINSYLMPVKHHVGDDREVQWGAENRFWHTIL
jgi:hypothetical protein